MRKIAEGCSILGDARFHDAPGVLRKAVWNIGLADGGGSGITEKIDRADGQIKREKALQIPGIHIMIEKMKAECSLLPGRMSKGLRSEDRDR